MLVSVASAVVVYLGRSKHVFVSCVKSFDIAQGAIIQFYFKSGKTATELYQDTKNEYANDCRIMHESSDGYRIDRKAGNRWRMILV